MTPRNGLMILMLALTSHSLLAQDDLSALGCGTLRNAYGPFDYRTDKSKLGIVEAYHFGPAQESLSKKSGLAGNIDYTLRAFPNHHRALMAMMKLGFRERKAKLFGAEHSVKCYMLRAETFRPDDAMVKVIHGLYLMQSGLPQEAVVKLEQARKLDSNNANVHYNLGLAYFDLNQFDLSLSSAQSAYAKGFPLPGLRDKLKRIGKWREPTVERTETPEPDAGVKSIQIAPDIPPVEPSVTVSESSD